MSRARSRHADRTAWSQSRPRRRLRKLAGLLAIAGGMMVLAAGAALAYFQTTDHANPAVALAATLTAPSGGTQNGIATPTAISIRWTAPSGYTPTGYTVLRCTGASCTPSSAPAVGGCSNVITSVVTATSCIDSDTALAAGQTYTYVVEALLDNWTSPKSAAFTGSTSAVARLTFTTQPSANQNIQAKGTGSFSVSVAITDANNAVATDDSTDTVTLAIATNPGGGVLSCTNAGGLTVTATSGIANFTGCAITLAGTGYTLTATSPSSPSLAAPSNANAFNITAGAASQLRFTIQPSAGQNIQAKGTGSFAVSVAVRDQNGNTLTGDSGRPVTLAIGTNPGGGVLSCTDAGGLTVTDSSGVASFSGCAITLAGTGYTLTASAASLAAPSNANAFNITAGTASQLSFTTQPSAGENIQAKGTGSFAVSVAVQDQNGNLAVGDSGRPVVLAIGTNPSGGSLSCTNTGGLTVSDSSGVASFTGCAITLTGTGYTLTASAAGLTAPSNANAFNIIAGAPAYLGFTNITAPITGATTANCTPNPAAHTNACTLNNLVSVLSYTANVTLFDQNGNQAPAGSSVTVSLASSALSSVSPGSVTIASGSSTSSGTFTESLGLGVGTATASATVSSVAFQSTIRPGL